jgi:hypothetical protein
MIALDSSCTTFPNLWSGLNLQHMISSGDYALKAETGEDLPTVQITAGLSSNDTAAGKACNNYQRPAGQVCCARRSFRPG